MTPREWQCPMSFTIVRHMNAASRSLRRPQQAPLTATPLAPTSRRSIRLPPRLARPCLADGKGRLQDRCAPRAAAARPPSCRRPPVRSPVAAPRHNAVEELPSGAQLHHLRPPRPLPLSPPHFSFALLTASDVRARCVDVISAYSWRASALTMDSGNADRTHLQLCAFGYQPSP